MENARRTYPANPEFADDPTDRLFNEIAIETDWTAPQTLTQEDVPLALQNSLILTNLFQLCSLKQLAPLRLVCKEWHQLSLPIWRANLPVTIPNNGSLIPHPKYALYYCLESFRREYLDMPITQTEEFPHRYLKLFQWDYDPVYNSVQRVWDAFGNNVQTLELNGCNFERVEEFRKVIYQSCPQLKSLRILNCSFHQQPNSHGQYIDPTYGAHPHFKSLSFVTPLRKDEHKLPITWQEIFSHFPSMTNLFVRVGTSRPDPEVTDEAERLCDYILSAIDAVTGHDKRALPFKTFTIQSDLEIIPTQEKLKILRRSLPTS